MIRLSEEKRRNIFLAVKEALNNINKYAGAHKIKITLFLNHDHFSFIVSDDGNEWKGEIDKEIFKKLNIYHKITITGDHNVLKPIDRFSQTIKGIIFKYFTHNNTTNWIDRLNKFIDTYNNTPHSEICDFTK